MQPIDRSTVWPYDERGEAGQFMYQRYAHPTGAAAEQALGALEGGDALLFGSGTAALPAGADVVWLESPANPVLTVPDWEAAHAHTGLVVCDATVSTPIFLTALDEGADVVLHSATKYLTGHHDALLGATVTRDAELYRKLYEARMRLGLSATPDAASSLLHGLETLEMRLARQTET